MLSIFLKSFLPLPLILTFSLQSANSQPEKPESAHKLRKVHRILPVGAKLSSPKVRSVHYEELEWRGEPSEGIKFPIGSDIPYTGKSYKLHPNGQKDHETNWKDGQRHGLDIGWHKNGLKSMEGIRKFDKRDGLWVYWYNNGQKLYEKRYKNGELHGTWITWYPKGQKDHEARWKNGKWHGLSRGWHENGQIMYIENWKDGELIEGFEECNRFLRSMPDEPYKFLKELPEEDLRVWLYAYDHYRKAKESLSYILSADQISSGKPQR